MRKNFDPPNFFLKTYSPYAQTLEAVKISHPRTPLGSQDPYLGVRPPKPEKLLLWPYFARKIFLPFGRSCKTLCHIHTSPKKWIRPFFGPFLTQKRPKKGKSKNGKSFLPPDRFLIGLRFPNDLTFFSNH